LTSFMKNIKSIPSGDDREIFIGIGHHF
jgi:hypothetical protein